MWLAYAIAAAGIWGLEYALLGRLLGDKISPLFLLSLQSAVAALTTGIACAATGTFRQESAFVIEDGYTLALIIFSTITFTLGNFMIAASIKEGNAVVAGFVEISYPLFIIAFSLALGWIPHIDARTIVGGAVVLAGILILKQGH